MHHDEGRSGRPSQGRTSAAKGYPKGGFLFLLHGLLLYRGSTFITFSPPEPSLALTFRSFIALEYFFVSIGPASGAGFLRFRSRCSLSAVASSASGTVFFGFRTAFSCVRGLSRFLFRSTVFRLCCYLEVFVAYYLRLSQQQ